MNGPSSEDRCTKREYAEAAAAGLQKYQKALALDLLYGSVPLPTAWVSRAEAELITLDHEVRLQPGQGRDAERLFGQVAFLCGTVIPALIEQEISRRRGAGVRLDRAEAESLRRGRGPRAVRDLLFDTCDALPHAVPTHLAEPVRVALDAVLAERLSRKAASSRAHEASRLMEACREHVEEFARRRRLSRPAMRWLLSEVVHQLHRNAERGRLPDNLRAWTLTTAKIKWRLRSAESSGVEPYPGHHPMVGEVLADDVASRLDLQRVLKEAGSHLDHRAGLLERLGEAERVNAVAHRVASGILIEGDIERVLDIVDGSPVGARDVTQELALAGLALSADRAVAVQRIIGDALRDAWCQAHSSGPDASS